MINERTVNKYIALPIRQSDAESPLDWVSQISFERGRDLDRKIPILKYGDGTISIVEDGDSHNAVLYASEDTDAAELEAFENDWNAYITGDVWSVAIFEIEVDEDTGEVIRHRIIDTVSGFYGEELARREADDSNRNIDAEGDLYEGDTDGLYEY